MTLPAWFLNLPVLSPGSRRLVVAIGVLLLVALLVRRGRRWGLIAVGAALVGAGLGAMLIWALEGPLQVTGPPLPTAARAWIIAGMAGVGVAVANVWRARWRRRLAAAATIPLLIVVAALGVNAAYGVNSTLGLVIGISQGPRIALPTAAPARANAAARQGPLGSLWVPPGDLPSHGRQGLADIPGAISHFAARPAGVYLPPAALVANPPRLPVLVFMMGQPGSPDITFVARALDNYAAKHRGLAPIAVVADQLGSPLHDTLCSDTSTYGRAETYLNVDVPNYIRSHLGVSTKRTDWAIGGYSNGGLCAIRFAARHPDLWGGALDIAGEAFPGSDRPQITLDRFFKGDHAAYAQERMTTILGQNRYRDLTAIFTISLDDPHHLQGARQVADAARTAGMDTTLIEFPNGGHGVGTLTQGLEAGIQVLAHRFGLQPRPGGTTH